MWLKNDVFTIHIDFNAKASTPCPYYVGTLFGTSIWYVNSI